MDDRFEQYPPLGAAAVPEQIEKAWLGALLDGKAQAPGMAFADFAKTTVGRQSGMDDAAGTPCVAGRNDQNWKVSVGSNTPQAIMLLGTSGRASVTADPV